MITGIIILQESSFFFRFFAFGQCQIASDWRKKFHKGNNYLHCLN